jgi:GGDEF domain-containing protein
MANVINFAEAQRRLKEREEELDIFARDSDKEIASVFSIEAARDIIVALEDIGIRVTDNPKSILDIFSIQEAIRGLIYRCLGEPHPYHAISESITIALDEDGDDDIYINYEELLDEFLEAMDSDDDR